MWIFRNIAGERCWKQVDDDVWLEFVKSENELGGMCLR